MPQTKNVSAVSRRNKKNASRVPGEGEIRCRGCSEIFRQLKKTHVFHSPACKSEYWNAQKRVAHDTAVCEQCAVEYVRERADQRYCSTACRLTAYAAASIPITALVPRSMLNPDLCGRVVLSIENGKLVSISAG